MTTYGRRCLPQTTDLVIPALDCLNRLRRPPPMTHALAANEGSPRLVPWAIGAILLTYAVAALLGLPQRATECTLAESHAAMVEHDAVSGRHPPPPLVMVLPFALLLLAIAVFPLWHVTEHWWESNLHRFLAAAVLGVVTLAYYALVHGHAVERHFLGHAIAEPVASGISWEVPWTIFQNAIFNEYLPFIVLLFSLYTISGGIRIEGDLPAHSLTNAMIIGIGAALANCIGTTGAAMVLVRLLLETNRERRHVRHTVVFFIFAVCNCGGCLLPIGDPPLFLGYLEGVDFLWTLALWRPWLVVNGALVAIYFLLDRFWYYPREARADIVVDELRVRPLRFRGIWPNAVLLVAVVFAVALLDPAKPFPGTDWHSWLYLREVVQLALVGLSVWSGSDAVRRDNGFTYAAIVEVAALFFGIFLCMQPALQILSESGGKIGLDTPAKFFWSTGALSAVLDNAPTYLVFFKAAQSLAAGGQATMAGVDVDVLAAISLGAVFMGAMTYIGNGPNFMVKAIAEKSGVRMPSFFGYMGYSFVILLPLFALVTFLFFT